jgi:DinB superfamily
MAGSGVTMPDLSAACACGTLAHVADQADNRAVTIPPWVSALEDDAPDVVACWRVFDWEPGRQIAARRELEARVAEGDAPRILAQQEAIGRALGDVLASLPERLLRAPGGEEDWNVAQAFAHTTAARRFLATWAALDADGSWPEHRQPTVTPSVPGRPDASREELAVLLEKSARAIREAAARLEGHEMRRCRMEHPLVGHLRCGEWLLFVGIHDLMHLEQLHRLRDADASAADAGA